ncbi:ATP-dependent protease LonB [Clostridium sp. 'deep sea']|uniref:ATP-dependent protease LonB n=1 Tax=Clostridium sp. 'deep sea' TaxID=2779445 RepID=UPI0018968354|nr:ATP-dependent protease LonB [Clostridium sp. 'deep sea']QOR36389.1 ATP-dependent protease LonB [Clostridium sp. 'deep sea']
MNGYTGVITILNFLFAAIIGIYFLRLLLTQNNSQQAIVKESRSELEKLRQKRAIKLSEPLSEKTRPKSFDEIIGQEDAIRMLRAALCGPNPQHILIYGPPGVGKTAAARLVLEEAKRNIVSPFRANAVFIELDAATARFDERGIADPLIGSVHDPIYQGAGSMGVAGIPQPKPGAVSKAHGGILFIDEIGELHNIQINKLLKVLEDRKVLLESAYYSKENSKIPEHIHSIFQKGLPADFRLIGATTRSPNEIIPAIRSRCLEIYFRPLTASDIMVIAKNASQRISMELNQKALSTIGRYAQNGREAVNLVQIAAGLAMVEKRKEIKSSDVDWLINCSRLQPRHSLQIADNPQVGLAYGMAVFNNHTGALIEVEAVVKAVASGKGSIRVSGIVSEEEFGGNGHKVKRRSMAHDSVENALTMLAKEYDIAIDSYDIHINFAGGAPVDGPSAGITISSALYSAFTGIPIANNVVMTGEVSLRAQIKPIGGVIDKLRAASRNNEVDIAIIPQENWQDAFCDYPGVKVIPVSSFSEVLPHILIDVERVKYTTEAVGQ